MGIVGMSFTFLLPRVTEERYPQLGGKHTGGTYSSPIVSSYKCDRLLDAWYEPNAAIKLCQLFALPNSYGQEIQNLLVKVERKIDRQQEIIRPLA